MISVAAIRMQQFGVQFYQASLSASDIDKLVRFEVLSYGERTQPVRGGRRKGAPPPSKVNWDLLERRIAANDRAYQRQIFAQLFSAAWNGRKYRVRSPTALRAFIRVAPDVVRRLDQEHADRADFRAIGRVIAPWGRRIGDLRFETEGAWKRNGTTVESLAKDLRLALEYPEGAAV